MCLSKFTNWQQCLYTIWFQLFSRPNILLPYFWNGSSEHVSHFHFLIYIYIDSAICLGPIYDGKGPSVLYVAFDWLLYSLDSTFDYHIMKMHSCLLEVTSRKIESVVTVLRWDRSSAGLVYLIITLFFTVCCQQRLHEKAVKCSWIEAESDVSRLQVRCLSAELILLN